MNVGKAPQPGSGAALPEQFTWTNATPYGGAQLIWRFFDHIGLLARAAAALAPHEKAKHAKYSLVQEVLLFLIGRMLGLRRVSDFVELEQDPLLKFLFGLPKLPDVTILYKELVRLGRTCVRADLQPLHEYVAGLTLGSEVIIDIASTVETVDGNQERSAVGYNPTKLGRASFHPQLCFDGLTRTLLDCELRPGNTTSSGGLVQTFTRVLDSPLIAGRHVRLVRGDRGYGNEDFMALLEERDLDFILRVRGTRPPRAWSDSLEYRPIGTTELGDVLEVASGLYRAGDWSRTRRVVVVRERAEVPVQGAPPPLPAIADEQFLATSLDWDEEDIFHSHNQRCTSETTMRTLKEDWGLDAFSKDEFDANAADMLLKGMAYNLTLAMQQRLAPKDRAVVHTAATIRRWWFVLPAVVANHARYYFLRLPREAEQGHYGQARAALAALTAGT